MVVAIVVGSACALLGVLAIILRSNAVYMLLTLCAGAILAELTAQDVTQILNSLISVNIPIYSYVQIALLLIAPVILLIMYRKSAGSKLILQLVPAIVFALISFMVISEALPYDMQTQIKESQIYSFIEPYYEIAIAVGLFACMFYFWIQKPRHDKPSKK